MRKLIITLTTFCIFLMAGCASSTHIRDTKGTTLRNNSSGGTNQQPPTQ